MQPLAVHIFPSYKHMAKQFYPLGWVTTSNIFLFCHWKIGMIHSLSHKPGDSWINIQITNFMRPVTDSLKTSSNPHYATHSPTNPPTYKPSNPWHLLLLAHSVTPHDIPPSLHVPTTPPNTATHTHPTAPEKIYLEGTDHLPLLLFHACYSKEVEPEGRHTCNCSASHNVAFSFAKGKGVPTIKLPLTFVSCFFMLNQSQ